MNEIHPCAWRGAIQSTDIEFFNLSGFISVTPPGQLRWLIRASCVKSSFVFVDGNNSNCPIGWYGCSSDHVDETAINRNSLNNDW